MKNDKVTLTKKDVDKGKKPLKYYDMDAQSPKQSLKRAQKSMSHLHGSNKKRSRTMAKSFVNTGVTQ